MRIYLTNLGKYNEGYLIGEWIDLPISNEELQKVLDRIGINEEYEEYFITDYEDDCMVYCDCNDMTDVAEQYAEETGLLNSIPENLQSYFDFEAFGRDMSYEGTFVFTNNGNCVQIL